MEVASTLAPEMLYLTSMCRSALFPAKNRQPQALMYLLLRRPSRSQEQHPPTLLGHVHLRQKILLLPRLKAMTNHPVLDLALDLMMAPSMDLPILRRPVTTRTLPSITLQREALKIHQNMKLHLLDQEAQHLKRVLMKVTPALKASQTEARIIRLPLLPQELQSPKIGLIRARPPPL